MFMSDEVRNALHIYQYAVQLCIEQKTGRARYLLEAQDGDFCLALNSKNPETQKYQEWLLNLRKALVG